MAAVEGVCSSQQYILGPEVEAFERELAKYCGAAHAVGCASGTDALWLALVGAGVQPGDSVLTTPFSFFASASSIVRAGARPVFVDIDPATFNLDPAQVENILRHSPRRKLRALLPVHLYGQCAQMDRLQNLADEFHLALIEDAAQAIGSNWENASGNTRRAGSMGICAAFSFYPTKNLSAYGDAGLVTTSDLAMAEHMRRLRNHGSPRRYVHTEFGWNCRLDEMQGCHPARQVTLRRPMERGSPPARRNLRPLIRRSWPYSDKTSCGRRAIIGNSGRFPDSPSLHRLIRTLCFSSVCSPRLPPRRTPRIPQRP